MRISCCRKYSRWLRQDHGDKHFGDHGRNGDNFVRKAKNGKPNGDNLDMSERIKELEFADVKIKKGKAVEP